MANHGPAGGATDEGAVIWSSDEVGRVSLTCGVDVSDYVVRRINGLKSEKVEHAQATLKQMQQDALELMRDLGDRDFEILVDLVFTTSGWQRQRAVGKTQKTLDLDLLLPSTGDRAIVQVKSSTTSA